MLLIAIAIWLPSALFAQAQPQESNQKTAVVSVPFVGCKSDGQAGPHDAPKGAAKIVQMDANTARGLAYYQAVDVPGVLAPRGWYCFGVYGSDGASLFVTPQPIKADDFLSMNWSGISGPGIQISDTMGDTSGRFDVAQIIARVFPTHKAFVEDVIKEGIEPASDFPFGPYPQDRLTYRSDEVVEYQTPAQSKGLGTTCRLMQNGDPIEGVAILQGQTPDLIFLAVRLQGAANNFAPDIIQQVEKDSAASSIGK